MDGDARCGEALDFLVLLVVLFVFFMLLYVNAFIERNWVRGIIVNSSTPFQTTSCSVVPSRTNSTEFLHSLGRQLTKPGPPPGDPCLLRK